MTLFSHGQPASLATPPTLPMRDCDPAPAAVDPPARDQPAGGPSRAVRDALRRWEGTAALLVIAVVYSAIQGATPDIIGIDGYYHIKVAVLMREQGWHALAPLDFPWLQLTILGPGRYTDHHFLFHLLQAPFTVVEPRVAAKMAAVLFAIVGLYTTYQFVARAGVRYPLLWIALLIACAPVFLWRQSMARTQSLSLTLIVLGIWALFAGRVWLLAVVGFLAALLFNGFFFVLGAPAAAALLGLAGSALGRLPATSRVSRMLPGADDRGPRSRPGPPLRFALAALAWTLLGLGLGLLLHPYFPRNVEFAFLHLLPKAVPAEQADVSVGLEWYPFSFASFMRRIGPTATLAIAGLVPIAWTMVRGRRWPDWRVLVLAILALGLLGMVARSMRLSEYFPVFGVMFCAWSWSDRTAVAGLLADLRRGAAWSRARVRRSRWLARADRSDPPNPRQADAAGGDAHDATRARAIGWRGWRHGWHRAARLRAGLAVAWPWLAALALAPALLVSVQVASRDARGGLSTTTYRDGALWLAANTPAGSRVFTTGWDDFPHMFFWNTHNTYLVGLDPTYMSLEDPELYRLWRSISSGQTPRPARLIRERFDSPFILTDLEHERFLRVAAADPGLEEVFRNRTVAVFRVREP